MMKKQLILSLECLLFMFFFALQGSYGQTNLSDSTFQGIKMRSIGPAFMSGRIADIAIHPEDDNLWYVAVGSGGVWKTQNAGITWSPIFDDQPVYSIGCVTIDPSNPHIVWVGTGENVGGRHVGFGDGIYKSMDGGNTWTNMGIKDSEHISKIIVHPENSSVLWVAAQGPLWNEGGERGFYKTTDGGKTWRKTLGDDKWTGVTDIAMDPRDPEVLYAATWQHHRNVAAYMGGGPGSGLHKSVDGGDTWQKLEEGLPSGNIGKIGLAISPINPDILYAALELNRRTGAVYRSADRGATWEKRSETVSGGTGPHYYQELYASPHQLDKIFLANVRMLVSDDGGKTFYTMKEEHKHSDNHALAFRSDDPDYLLVGSDGGLYESFDLAEHWRYIANLPVTQYYKVAVDDAEPFYFIYGGTQDNSTQGGPSRTDNVHGIRNADWFLTLFADGHQPATEPGNPDIMYSEWQEGNLMRIDRTTGEQVYIKPQPAEGDPQERFNWDAPILVSPHDPTTIFFASQRVWKSENRGDSWKAISDDLTRNQDRITLPIMGKTQSWDSPWDFYAMSNYNTITSLAESSKKAGLIYAGTDDGIIQITEDGGANWRKIEVKELPGVPATAFVNDIKADLYDIVSAGKSAFRQSRWDEAINNYDKAINLLEDNRELLRQANTEENRKKLARIMLQASVIRDKQDAARHLKEKQYDQAVAKLTTIIDSVSTSEFSGEDEFSTVSDEAQQSIEKAEKDKLLSDKISYLEDNFEELFTKHYSGSPPESLVEREVVFEKKMDSKLLFRLQCVEVGRGRPLQLVMKYTYDQNSGAWRFYSDSQ